MSASNLNARLQEAIALAQSGQRDEARALLESVVAADPSIELAWLWLATVSPNREERIEFLRRALELNPNNPTTQAAYTRLAGQPYQPAAMLYDSYQADVAPAGPLSRLPVSRGNLILIAAIAAFSLVTIVLAVALRSRSDDGDESGGSNSTRVPTIFTAPDTDTPAPIIPTNTSEPTSIFPTNTPGPSPTKLTYPPTWTPLPTRSPVPTRRPANTWTPIPTWTASATVTETSTPLPPSDTPTPSNTPGRQTMTAQAREAQQTLAAATEEP